MPDLPDLGTEPPPARHIHAPLAAPGPYLGHTRPHSHRLWGPTRRAVTEGGGPVGKAKGVRFLRMENGAAVFEVGSGSYRFGVRASHK
ncbi:hypothetical protein [Streptomyces sp. NBC_01451]|uniref:hypothetical protein n=1 Tax=Streptomyces sp. NBC_01451 TaxID=2903872 RepID=UPI002E375084|nr:hypothetical protein [Streptomyces sp. NBC_01451]